MSINRKSLRAATAAGALIALLGFGDAALAQAAPDSQPAATTPAAESAPAAKMAHHKTHHVRKHRSHRAKGATKHMTPAKAPATSAPATKG
jgi:hypothetical protein